MSNLRHQLSEVHREITSVSQARSSEPGLHASMALTLTGAAVEAVSHEPHSGTSNLVDQVAPHHPLPLAEKPSLFDTLVFAQEAGLDVKKMKDSDVSHLSDLISRLKVTDSQTPDESDGSESIAGSLAESVAEYRLLSSLRSVSKASSVRSAKQISTSFFTAQGASIQPTPYPGAFPPDTQVKTFPYTL